MSGSISTLRPSGMPAGYPAEIDANVKIRWVDNLLINMREQSTDLLKYLGGPAQFTFNNTKCEWVEDDGWNRRLSHGGLVAAGTTALVVTGTAHRYPVGTLLYHVTDGEVCRVSAIADANTLTIARDIPGSVAEGAWGATDEVLVGGSAMAEDAAWTFSPGGIFTLPYNYAQVMSEAIHVTFARMETALYGLQGSDLDYLAANVVARKFVEMEEGLVTGQRFEGASATRPSLFGGLEFYITAANGAQITALAGAALTRKDFDDMLQNLFYTVGPEKMARTCIVPGWGKRKVSSWFSTAERLGPGAGQTAGVVIDRINTDFGVIEFLLHTSIAKNEIFLLNKEMIKMGNFGTLGRPHLIVPAGVSTTGPYVERFYYAMLSAMVKGVSGMGKISGFSLTA